MLEYLVIFDNQDLMTGGWLQIFRKRGTSSGVVVSPADKKAMGSGHDEKGEYDVGIQPGRELANCVATHNHPSGSTFSPQDILFAVLKKVF